MQRLWTSTLPAFNFFQRVNVGYACAPREATGTPSNPKHRLQLKSRSSFREILPSELMMRLERSPSSDVHHNQITVL